MEDEMRLGLLELWCRVALVCILHRELGLEDFPR